MAKKQEVVVEVSAKTNKLDDALKASEEAFDNLGESSKKALEGADRLTGGLASGLFKGVAGARSLIGSMGLLKVALISTGIGAIVVAVGTLAAYFTQTAEGAKLLEQGLNMLKSAFTVLLERAAQVGGAIVKFFQGDFQGAAEDAKNAVKGIGEEIKKEVAIVNELTQATQKLRSSTRELTVETAKQRAEIERLKKISEDTTLDIDKRIQAAKRAAGIEQQLVKQRLSNAREELRLQLEADKLTNESEESLDKVAELRVRVYEIENESLSLQTELQNKVNGLKAEAIRLEEERIKVAREAKTEEIKSLNETNTALQKRRVTHQQIQNEQGKTLIVAKDANEDAAKSDNNYLHDYIQIQNRKAQATLNFSNMTLQAVSALNDAFTKGDEKRAERNFKISKAISLASAIMNTAEGVTTALTDKTQPSTILRLLQTAAVAATGIAQIATISRQKWPPAETTPTLSGGGGGGMGGGSAPQAPQIDLSFMRGSQTSGFKSYVLASDVSNAQQANQKIKEQASLVG
jgi:hypothetical protein